MSSSRTSPASRRSTRPETAVVDFARVADAVAADVGAGGRRAPARHEVVGLARRGSATVVETDRRRRRGGPGGGLRRRARRSPRRAQRRAGRAAHRPVPGRLPRAPARAPAPRPRARLPGPRPGVPVPRDPHDDASRRRGLARPERRARARQGGIPAPGRLAPRRPRRGPLRRLPAAGAPALADGSRERSRDVSTRRFVAAAQRLLPELEAADVLPGPSGIRAQALAPDGTLLDDFVFHEADGVLHVRNAPSPGATSALAIARVIVDRVGRRRP